MKGARLCLATASRNRIFSTSVPALQHYTRGSSSFPTNAQPMLLRSLSTQAPATAATPTKQKRNRNKPKKKKPEAVDSESPDFIKSKRQQFRDIQVPSSIQQYIEMIGVGIPNRNKGAKRTRSALFDSLEAGRRTGRTGSYTKPPPPFSTGGGGGSSNTSRNRDNSEQQQDRRVVVIGSAGSAEDSLPTNKEMIPEVALAGRSNVGKSTLLNALLYGNHPRRPRGGNDSSSNSSDDPRDYNNPLVRQFRRGQTPANVKLPKGIKAVTSDKPGETRKITFYQLSSSKEGAENVDTASDETTADSNNGDNNNAHPKSSKVKLRLVDLPGYGFSFTPKDQDGFEDLLLSYLLDRGKALKRILLLLDGRHGMKKADIDFIETLQERAFASPGKNKGKIPPIQLVLTKCDLVPRDDLARRVVLVRQQLSDIMRRETSALPVLLVSARPGVGFNNIRGGRQSRARGGVLELQKELAALVPSSKK